MQSWSKVKPAMHLKCKMIYLNGNVRYHVVLIWRSVSAAQTLNDWTEDVRLLREIRRGLWPRVHPTNS